jgi:hypothetical protein
MPRNGSGVYSPPSANYPAVSGTLIESADRNAIDSDIATAITNSIAVNGESVVTNNIPFGGNKLTVVGAATARTDAMTLANAQDGTGVYVATVGGTADVITISPNPSIVAYVAGQMFSFIASGANTTNVTVNVSGLGAKAITKNGTVALVAGDIPNGSLMSIRYDGTQFQIVGSAAFSGGTITTDLTMSASSIIEAEGADVASATTTNIWATDGNTRHITGNTTITSFGTAPQTGARMRLIFDGTPLLTHGANLNLNAGIGNIQIEAGDYADVYADTTTQFDVVVTRKSGQAIVVQDVIRSGLMQYEGVQINAGLAFLTTSQTVGPAIDGKRGTVAITLNFTNAASVIESILDFGASSFFNVSRSSTGNITITAKNAAGTTILSIATTGNPCALAGQYTILASWDLAVAGSGRLYIGNTPNYSEITFTNDTIDYTHTSFNIGSLTGGASALTAQLYVVYFDETIALNFATKTERAKFIDDFLNINFMGLEGTLPSPTSQRPYIFLAYSYELFNGFLTPRGKSNIQSISTRPTESAVKAIGYYDASIDLFRGVTIAAKDFQINNTTTLVGIGDMAASGVLSDFGFFAKPSVRYLIEIRGMYSSAATTTGARFVLKQPSVGSLGVRIEQTLTATTSIINYVGNIDLPATASTTSLLSNNLYTMEGFINPTGGGSHFMAAFASEVGGSDITLVVGNQMMTITKLR